MDMKITTELRQQTRIRIKRHEGFRMFPYKCTEGFLTGGFGHRIMHDDTIPITREGWESVFIHDYNIAENAADVLVTNNDIKPQAFCIIVEMCFQMGQHGVSKFKNFLKAVHNEDYEKAADEMLDSKWAKQTPKRALEMSNRMRDLE